MSDSPRVEVCRKISRFGRSVRELDLASRVSRELQGSMIITVKRA
jgi:hypothetical protein